MTARQDLAFAIRWCDRHGIGGHASQAVTKLSRLLVPGFPVPAVEFADLADAKHTAEYYSTPRPTVAFDPRSLAPEGESDLGWSVEDALEVVTRLAVHELAHHCEAMEFRPPDGALPGHVLAPDDPLADDHGLAFRRVCERFARQLGIAAPGGLDVVMRFGRDPLRTWPDADDRWWPDTTRRVMGMANRAMTMTTRPR